MTAVSANDLQFAFPTSPIPVLRGINLDLPRLPLPLSAAYYVQLMLFCKVAHVVCLLGLLYCDPGNKHDLMHDFDAAPMEQVRS